MHQVAPKPSAVLSPQVLALIAASPRLRRQLFPGGLFAEPYEVLDYQATLILHDPKGLRATFRRRERVRFLRDGVSSILDHAWGDGVVITSYHNEAGSLKHSFRDEGRRHLMIRLRRVMRKGETLTFEVRRTAMVGFTNTEEWLEMTIDHPVQHLTRSIIFPKGRPCRRATLHYNGCTMPLPVIPLAQGKTLVHFTIPQARPHTPYIVCWRW